VQEENSTELKKK